MIVFSRLLGFSANTAEHTGLATWSSSGIVRLLASTAGVLVCIQCSLPVGNMRSAEPVSWHSGAFELPEGIVISARRVVYRQPPEASELARARQRMESFIERQRSPDTTFVSVPSLAGSFDYPLFRAYLVDEAATEAVLEELVLGGGGKVRFHRREFHGPEGMRFRDLYTDDQHQVEVSIVNGARNQTTISRVGYLDEAESANARGVELDLVRLRALTRATLGPLEQGNVSERQTKRGRIEFVPSEASDLLSAPDILPPPGFRDYAGAVQLEFDFDARMLEVRWEDPEGGVLESRRVSWSLDTGRVQSLERRVYLPGSDHALLTSETSVSYGEESEVPRWEPVPGERIVDLRFAGRVQYVADSEGGIPTEFDVGLRAKAAGFVNRGIAPRSSIRALRDEDRPARDAPVTSASHEWLEVLPELLDLGIQETGTVLPFEILLLNRSATSVTLGAPRPDCGCLNVVLDKQVLGPGELAMLTGLQKISTEGETDRRISVPFESRDAEGEPLAGVLVANIAFIGDSPARVLSPKVLHLGRVLPSELESITGELHLAVEALQNEAAIEVHSTLFSQFECKLVGITNVQEDARTLSIGVAGLSTTSHGLLKAPIEVYIPDSGDVLTAMVTLNVAPEGTPLEQWPDCRLLVPCASTEIWAEVTIPGLESPRLANLDELSGSIGYDLTEVAEGHKLSARAVPGLEMDEAFLEELLLIRDQKGLMQVSVLLVR